MKLDAKSFIAQPDLNTVKTEKCAMYSKLKELLTIGTSDLGDSKVISDIICIFESVNLDEGDYAYISKLLLDASTKINSSLVLFALIQISNVLIKNAKIESTGTVSNMRRVVNILDNYIAESTDESAHKCIPIMKNLAAKVEELEKNCGIETHPYEAKTDISNIKKALHEEAIVVTPDYYAGAQGIKVQDKVFDTNKFITEFFNSVDEDYFVAKLKYLPQILTAKVALTPAESAGSLSAFWYWNHTIGRDIISYAMKTVRSTHGKNSLRNALIEVKNNLSKEITTSFDDHENLNDFIDEISETIKALNTMLGMEDVDNEAPAVNTSDLMDEMGMGFVYDIFPEDHDDYSLEESADILSKLDCAVQNVNLDNHLMQTMNESTDTKSNIEEASEKAGDAIKKAFKVIGKCIGTIVDKAGALNTSIQPVMIGSMFMVKKCIKSSINHQRSSQDAAYAGKQIDYCIEKLNRKLDNPNISNDPVASSKIEMYKARLSRLKESIYDDVSSRGGGVL